MRSNSLFSTPLNDPGDSKTVNLPNDINNLISRIDDAIRILTNMKCATDSDMDSGRSAPSTDYKNIESEINKGDNKALLSVVTLFSFMLIVSKERYDTKVIIFLVVGITALTVALLRRALNLKNAINRSNDSSNKIINLMSKDERITINQLLFDLGIKNKDQNVEQLISILIQKKNSLINSSPCKTAFMMAKNDRLGKFSSVKNVLFTNEIFDKNLCKLIFQFADFTPVPKDKAEVSIKYKHKKSS